MVIPLIYSIVETSFRNRWGGAGLIKGASKSLLEMNVFVGRSGKNYGLQCPWS